MFAAAFAAVIATVSLPVSAAFGGAGGAVTVAQNYDTGMPLFQASSWNVTEDGGWTGVWTFNSNRRSMNAVWTNQSTGLRVNASNMRVSQNGNEIIVERPGLGNYVGTVNSSGTSMSGTMSWSNGRFSASIRNGNGGGYNGGGNGGGYNGNGNGNGYNGNGNGSNGGGGNGAPMMSASSWYVTEDGGWTAVWTFTGRRTMSGVWTNNQTGERVRVGNMTVRQNGQQIVVARPGLGNYVGTLNGNGNSMSGTLSWSSGHFNARIQN